MYYEAKAFIIKSEISPLETMQIAEGNYDQEYVLGEEMPSAHLNG